MTLAAITKAAGRPVARAVHLAKRVNREVDLVGLIEILRGRQVAVGVLAGRAGT
jgi:hypothetical protein